VYHSYMEYGDGSSNLYLHDFKSKSTRQLNQPGWNIEDPMNAHFSPDGRYLTFMGRQNGAWHVFAWAIGGTQAPSNLTAAIGGRNEDPKFSFDGRQVVLKHEGDIRLATLVFNGDGSVGVSAWKAVTGDGWSTEESMPFLTPSGKYVVYATGAGDSLRVVRRNLENGQVSPLATPAAGGRDYYPVVRDYTAYFLSRTQPAGNDQLAMVVPNSPPGTPAILPLNHCQGDNSDAAPVNEDYLIFSSTSFDPTYSLLLGDIAAARVWRLDPAQINLPDGRQKLGASYTAAR
ncbi:TolB-like translocation protein, partial [Pseudomonas aeruginosa]|nr:TolB-like translocation protein [Pseudomonas aeruginosa]